MLLIEKGKRARAICRECRKLHGYQDCPARAERVREQKRLKRFFELGLFRGAVFGEGESVGRGADKSPTEPPLTSYIADCCQRLANLVGTLRTVNRKFGIQDPRSNSNNLTQSQAGGALRAG